MPNPDKPERIATKAPRHKKMFIRFLNTLPLAVGIPLIPSPRWERGADCRCLISYSQPERGIKIAFFLFIPRPLAAG